MLLCVVVENYLVLQKRPSLVKNCSCLTYIYIYTYTEIKVYSRIAYDAYYIVRIANIARFTQQVQNRALVAKLRQVASKLCCASCLYHWNHGNQNNVCCCALIAVLRLLCFACCALLCCTLLAVFCLL